MDTEYLRRRVLQALIKILEEEERQKKQAIEKQQKEEVKQLTDELQKVHDRQEHILTKTSEMVQISDELEQVIQTDCPLFYKTHKKVIDELISKAEKAKTLLEQRSAVDDCIICTEELKPS